MRVRCSRGLSIHTFHGNLFVRSTDLLSLPNCNPDSGFGMQVTIDEDLRDFQNVAFQAALLYTSSRG
jgi:protein transport protein SEC24